MTDMTTPSTSAEALAHECEATHGDPVKADRAETEPCQRGTLGCSVDHRSPDSPCQTW